MDTIIKLCRRAAGEEEDVYNIKLFPIQDYRLIQAELREEFAAHLFLRSSGPVRDFRFAALRPDKYRQRRRQERLAQAFRAELASLLDERDDNYCIADKNMVPILPFPEFDGYLEKRWVQRLMRYAVYPRFVVLGTAPYLPEVLCETASRMKSLLWILPDHCHAEMLEDFAEHFYQEYGLAIDLQFLRINESYGQLRVAGKWLDEPVNILDFTQDRHIPMFTPGSGSIWLDMAAVEEKRRRIEARKLKVSYFSLKKQWEQPQKAPYLLDTANKNRYNT